MGYVRVQVTVCNVVRPSRRQELELLVDSGAIYSMVPREVLVRLGIRPVGKQKFKTADGSLIERDYGWMRLELGDQIAYTRVVFGETKDASVLGVTSLEELGLKINPVTGKLEPMELLLV